VGSITALTWALEVGDTSRFRSIKQAISYCGLCSAEIGVRITLPAEPPSPSRSCAGPGSLRIDDPDVFLLRKVFTLLRFVGTRPQAGLRRDLANTVPHIRT